MRRKEWQRGTGMELTATPQFPISLPDEQEEAMESGMK